MRFAFLLLIIAFTTVGLGAQSRALHVDGRSGRIGYVGEYLEILTERSLFERLQEVEELPRDFRRLVLSGRFSSDEDIDATIERVAPGNYRAVLSGGPERAVVQWGIDDVLRHDVSSLFRASTDDVPALDFTDHAHWLRLNVHNTGRDPIELVMELDKNTYSWFDLFYSADGTWIRRSGSYEDPLSRRVIQESRILFPIELAPGEHVLYMRMDNRLIDTVPVVLWTADRFYRQNVREKFVHGVVSGATLLLFAYALFLTFSLKETGYLYLALLILFGYMVHIADTGLGMILIWPESPMVSIAVMSLAFPLTIVVNLIFCRHYLPVRRLTPAVDVVLIAIMGVAGALAIVQFFIPIQSRFLSTVFAALLDYVSVVPLLIASIAAFRRERRGDRPSAFVLAAISLQLLSYVEFWLSRFNVIPLGLIDFLHVRSIGFVVVMMGGVRFKMRSLQRTIDSLRRRVEEIVATKRAPTSSKALTDETSIKVEAVRELIEKSYTEPLYRDDLAASVGLSGDHLGRMFKRMTGVKISEYTNRLRIDEARRRLTEGDRRIVDIAFDVGFENLRTFNLAFAKLVGTSPSAYRRTGETVRGA